MNHGESQNKQKADAPHRMAQILDVAAHPAPGSATIACASATTAAARMISQTP